MTTIYVADYGDGTPSYSNVTAAIADATYNDTVIVSAGSEIWADTLALTKAIILKGAGIGVTNITKAGDTIQYNPDATSASNDYRFEIDGFSLSGGILLIDSGPSHDTQSVAKSKIVIGNNSFSDIYIDGTFWGVIYNNTLTSSGDVIGVIGNGIGDFNRYDDYLAFGGSRLMYIEDNTFTGDGWYTETGNGSRWAWRYNTNSGASAGVYPLLDEHGCQDSGNPGTMIAEIYGNIFNFDSGGTWNYQRGGRVLMFNNRNTGNDVDNIWQEDSYDPDVDCNVDWEPASEIVSPNTSYFWNNWVVGYHEPKNCTIGNNPFGHLGLNVTAWNYNANTLNGGTEKGINIGSGSPPATCSTGDGYWKTTYAVGSTPPTTLAEMRTYCQAGTFYRATGTNTWDSGIQMYEYPHPLRGGAKKPSSPQNVRVSAITRRLHPKI